MSSQKQQYHIPYYFRSQLRPVRRPVFLSQLGSSHDTPHHDQQTLDIASHDLPLARLRELSEDLEITNTLGRMVTFDVFTRTWVEWQRPVAASGLESFENLVRPLCPHAANGFRVGCEMHVHRKTDHGKVTWVFQASHDGCEFMVKIPDIPRSLDYILRDLNIRSPRNRRNRSHASTSSSPSLRIQRRHGRLNTARPIPLTPSSTSASSLSGPSPSSSSSPATPSSSSSVALTEGNDRLRAYDKVLKHVEHMENILNITCKSRSHEAADRDLPPTSLMSYHPTFKPVPFTHLQFYDSMIGRAVREWNSPAGVSTEVWFYILASNVLCYGCQKMYSIDGLEAHAPNGIFHSEASDWPLCNNAMQEKDSIIDISDDEDENLAILDKGKGCAYENS
ncbi:hypothetical protein PILCRDRAFT_782995 [Piloderma croceum F 1598]|uniref:Uncharacterized protein n=1 Tax=Piloderma croceum (strain F 1598) TaxID=765440 RepID=A0A0C3C1V5_PILCF|nr:hypothetical protein PILCRDRAFT_782995 [Piloderma croceum F 1598]